MTAAAVGARPILAEHGLDPDDVRARLNRICTAELKAQERESVDLSALTPRQERALHQLVQQHQRGQQLREQELHVALLWLRRKVLDMQQRAQQELEAAARTGDTAAKHEAGRRRRRAELLREWLNDVFPLSDEAQP